jgi:hypothetical protein
LSSDQTENEPIDSMPPKAGEALGTLDDVQRATIKHELAPGERLLWAERALPPPLPAIGRFPALFAALLCGFSGFALAVLFGIYGLRVMGPAELLFVLGLAPAALALVIALGLIGRRIQLRRLRWQLSRTFYALTDRRVLVGSDASHVGAISGSALAAGMFDDTLCVEHKDGSGDVLFVRDGAVLWPETSFIGVAQVRRVERLIRRALLAGGRNPGSGPRPGIVSPP